MHPSQMLPRCVHTTILRLRSSTRHRALLLPDRVSPGDDTTATPGCNPVMSSSSVVPEETLITACPTSRTTIPDASCSVYRDRPLSAPDWEKVLGWARFMQGMLNQESCLKQQQAQQEALPAGGAGQPPQQQPSPRTERRMRPIRCVLSASPYRKGPGSITGATPEDSLLQ